jgi:hypothetical protein
MPPQTFPAVIHMSSKRMGWSDKFSLLYEIYRLATLTSQGRKLTTQNATRQKSTPKPT